MPLPLRQRPIFLHFHFLPSFHLQGTVEETLLNSLDILTFVVPPILPAALTANNAFAQKRLQKKGIYCLHSKHICLCGGIDIVAFDKVMMICMMLRSLALFAVIRSLA